MILLLSHEGDPVVGRVAPLLEARGAQVLHLDDAAVPTRAALTVALGAGGLRRTLRLDGRSVDLAELRVAWDHRPGAPIPAPALVRPSAAAFSGNEARRLVDDLWHTLPIAWFPARKAQVLRGQHKVSQLRLARSLGFLIPPTLVSSDPSEARAFFREHGGRVIHKTFWMTTLPPRNGVTGGYTCFTGVIQSRALGELSRLRACPVILQAHVPKDVELRVTVVGDRALACEIASQASHQTWLDCRRGDQGRVVYRAVQLPPEVEARCLALVAALGLRFGTIDLIRTPEGEFVFLEINPSGQWRWIEDRSGLPIAATIADWLVRADEQGVQDAH